MGLFNNVGGINKVNADLGITKADKAVEAQKIGAISFKFEDAPKIQRAIELFGEEDAAFAIKFAEFASDFDPEANLL